MAKVSNTAKLAQAIAKRIIAEQTFARLAIGQDAAIIAAHEVFQMGPGRARAFRDAYVEAMNWIAGLYVDDADLNRDETLAYAKTKRDEIICKIVGPDNFVPFDLSYGAAYMDEARRIRIKMKEDKTE